MSSNFNIAGIRAPPHFKIKKWKCWFHPVVRTTPVLDSKLGLIIWLNWGILQAIGRPETMSTHELRGGVLCSMNVCVWDHTWVSVCMSSKHHNSTFILFLSHSRMPCSILSRVGWVWQWRKTWTACNLVADGMSQSHSSGVPHATERYKNLQL